MRLLDALMRALSPSRCTACALPLTGDAAFCAACVATLEPPPPLPAGVTAAFAFGGAVAEALRRLKYGGRVELLRPMRRLILERLPSPSDVDLVVPVLSHRDRLRERGFDQAALLATAVADTLDRPLRLDLLTRTHATPRLAGLGGAARAGAVAGAFRAGRASGYRLLLVDDVRTTGATLDAAASALVSAGATVRSHVLAATPRG